MNSDNHDINNMMRHERAHFDIYHHSKMSKQSLDFKYKKMIKELQEIVDGLKEDFFPNGLEDL